jgi:hypothetical protein
MDTSLTLHQIAPIINVILEERRKWEARADESMREREFSEAAALFGKAQIVDDVLNRVIEAATGKEVSHV